MSSTKLARFTVRRRLGAAVLLTSLVALTLPAAVGAARPVENLGAGRLVARAATFSNMQVTRAGIATRRYAPVRTERVVGPRGSGANIVATYSGFSAAAKTAFQRAINILKVRINSSVTIKVNAQWVNMGNPNILGGASATSDWIGANNRVFPVALAEAKCSCNMNGSAKEIIAQFNSSRTDWYLGASASTPSGKYDLTSVVLHELIHGIGFYSSMWVSGAQGMYGYHDGSPPPIYKDTYDIQEWSGAGANALKLAKGANYPNPSAALKTQLTDNSVYFGNPTSHVVAYRNGQRAKLFAPNPWQPGSSNSHFDEAAFPAGSAHGLMTPYLDDGETQRNVSGLTKALLRDRGWTTN